MHDVGNAINILDPSKTIDKKICVGAPETSSWTGAGSEGTVTGSAGKCVGTSTHATQPGLANFVSAANKGSGSTFTDDVKLSVVPLTSTQISKDVSNLARDQKGVVSSAFAKTHEGAEIVEIRSISTTSVM